MCTILAKGLQTSDIMCCPKRRRGDRVVIYDDGAGPGKRAPHSSWSWPALQVPAACGDDPARFEQRQVWAMAGEEAVDSEPAVVIAAVASEATACSLPRIVASRGSAHSARHVSTFTALEPTASIATIRCVWTCRR
jgi:hypothetical protein